MRKDGQDHEAQLHDQTNLLPKRELMFVFAIMALSLCVCFIDQNGIVVLLPSIAKDLHAQSTIAWAGTSALIANTVFQVLYGRLSDLFGRKNILLSALVLLSISDLICGLAPNATVLYVFRGMAGIANGGVTSLTMMIVSDVVTLQQRGKYQGILGAMVGTGNAVGPLIAAGFAMHTTWRGLFYLLAPLILFAAAASWKYLPSNMPKQNVRETVKKIDFLGVLFGTVAIVLILIPISEGGHSVAWSSPTIIAMLTIGGVSAILFIVAEHRFAKLPMMPLSMFRVPSVAVMLAQSFLVGASYYSYLYYLPLYYQNVHDYTVLTSALLLLPLVFSQAVFSTLAGLYISRMNRYIEILYAGFATWIIGGGMLLLAARTTSKAYLSGCLILLGFGTGCTFQPTLVALQAHSPKSQRAVVTSNRNFLRSLGGAVGLAVSSGIMGNVLKGALPERLQGVAANTFALPDLATFSEADRAAIEGAYASASRAVFVWCMPLLGLSLIGCVVVRDRGLQRKEDIVAADDGGGSEEKNSSAVEGVDVEKGTAGVCVRSGSHGVSKEIVEEDGEKARGEAASGEKSGAIGLGSHDSEVEHSRRSSELTPIKEKKDP